MKPADHHPNHKWIVSKKGFELLQEWNVQQAKRDQDSFDMYIFSDFSGYGTCEVIENMVKSLTCEFKVSLALTCVSFWPSPKKRRRDHRIRWRCGRS